jgi:hypothetical protein
MRKTSWPGHREAAMTMAPSAPLDFPEALVQVSHLAHEGSEKAIRGGE